MKITTFLMALSLMVMGCSKPISMPQDVYQRNYDADVQHYLFNLSLNDDTNEIIGEAEVSVEFLKTIDTFNLDLIGKNGTYGMEIIEVLENGEKAKYTYNNDKIKISPTLDLALNNTYKIKYKGIPKRGLVIDTTKYGQRSFFGDNWPNLARHWLPSVDHPYDKASIEFRITAPEHYEVVATGIKKEERNLGNGYKLTSYSEPAVVATKVATIGVTKFAFKDLGNVGDIEVSAWVYPENSLEGFEDFQEATKILTYFIDEVGPYSYAKLANMQVKTAWGGLENAGTISYNEKLITGKREIQGLMAHEIAHQWFGNSASENSWNHVWLSEGFATYFAILYQESVDGNEKRKAELIQDRKEVIEYFQKNPSPIVDYSIKDPMKVLNRNSYQKGGWVLNMLRHRLGDEVFWKGIQVYYKTYKDANAMSSDFQRVMEQVSGQDLKEFFDQWLYEKGYPELEWSWKYNKGKLTISVKQKQKHHTFKFPVEFGIVKGGVRKIESFYVDKKSNSFMIDMNEQPDDVKIDPEVWLMFEEK
jgi:aminopeptidase N